MDKYGLEQLVSAQQDFILTVQCAYNVLMVKNGMQTTSLALVSLAINGMEGIVQFHTLVLMEEFGAHNTTIVSVPTILIGQVMHALQSQNVQEDNTLIQLLTNVFVSQTSNGMVELAFNAIMVVLGM